MILSQLMKAFMYEKKYSVGDVVYVESPAVFGQMQI